MKKDSNKTHITTTRSEAGRLLSERVKIGKELSKASINNAETLELESKKYVGWYKYNLKLLENLFTDDSFVDEYASEDDGYETIDKKNLWLLIDDHYHQVDEEIHILETIIDRLELMPESHDNKTIDEKNSSKGIEASISHQLSKYAGESKIDTTIIITKVFISHASTDKNFVEEIIEILETIGLTNEQIFCTSFEGYSIGLGEDFLQRIKNELDENVLVLFVLSENFYKSPICLCEMGATWIKTNEHIPILIPPFDFTDVKGVIPMTQGFKVNDSMKLNSLKQKIEKSFGLTPIEASSWERKRDRVVGRINKLL